MKRLWVALILLAALFAGAMLHARAMVGFTGEVAGLLDLAGRAAEAGRWEDAAALTRRAEGLWAGRETALRVLLRHADTDAIYAGFRETLALLDSREYGEYAAANARLITQIELLYEAEQLTLKNIF